MNLDFGGVILLNIIDYIYKFFKLEAKSSNIKREIIAGVTNYFTMIYIVLIVPELLAYAIGGSVGSLVTLTSISFAISGLASILLGIKTNLPLVQGPSIVIATFISDTICKNMGYSYQQAMAIVFLSGILFFIMAITGIEEKIHNIIPLNIKYAVTSGIGFLIIVNGLRKGHILENDSIIDIFNSDIHNVLTAFVSIVGVVIIIILLKYNVHAAVFIGKIICILIGIPLGLVHLSQRSADIYINDFILQLDFSGLFQKGAIVIIILFVICIMDIFETISVYIAMDHLVNENGKSVPQVLELDAITTSIGALIGSTNISTYAESTTGIIEGGRSGLTAVVTGILFLATVPFAPLVSFVPSAATATTLIAAGIIMAGVCAKIDFNDIAQSMPAIITLIIMPITDSILTGIAVGIGIYVFVHLFLYKFEKISVSLVILAITLILMLFFLPL